MLCLLVAGIAAAMNFTLRSFLEIATRAITDSVVFPGATPVEIEEAIVIPIEDALQGLEAVRKLTHGVTGNHRSAPSSLKANNAPR